MKRKKAALYDPFLDVMGGGEKHILSILKVLEEKGFEIHIFWNNDVNDSIKHILNINFSNKITYHKNIFITKQPFVNKYRSLKPFDIFFYVTNGSYFFSSSKKNYIFSMVPDKKLYKMGILNKIKTYNYEFISNSYFTKNCLKKWKINSKVLYPYIGKEYLSLRRDVQKEKYILSVGRFFRHLHSKRQDITINLFKELKKSTQFKDFKLILAGGLKDEDKSYFHKLQKLADNDSSIIFKTNISHNKIFELYLKSQFYWHLAGYEVNEEESPELTEHLGISPVEAMACQCITLCYKAGGPKEIVKDEENGFLFKNQDELLNKMNMAYNNLQLQNKIKNNAKEYVNENFSYKVFKENVIDILKL